VIGSGKRVRETALPALLSLADRFEITGIYARTAKEIDVAGESHAVRPIGFLSERELAACDLVYLAVGKDATPKVLAHLARFPRSRIELLIDTPVVRFKHFRHVGGLSAFRRVSVAEDTFWLPWYDAVRAAIGQGAIGDLRRVLFERSAYAYHGLAMAKALCGSTRILRARRTWVGDVARRELELSGGRSVVVIEPRDYAIGRVLIEGTSGAISDRPDVTESALQLEPMLDRGDCVGFRAGGVAVALAPAEIELARGDPPETGVIARMDAMKRVGFRRLLQAIDAGRGAYPLEAALDDMVVDYFLERVGFWRPSPVTDVRSIVARGLWSAVSRLGR
jgi:hypothetical protein